MKIIKTEGPTDLLALISAGLRQDETACCNVYGCDENPIKTPWLLDFVRGHDVVTVHDADEPGQAGATMVEGRPGWATYMAKTATTSKLVKLPYPITKTKGKDLRDYFTEGHSRADFDKLIDQAADVKPANDSPQVIEAVDDPHRLARINLQRYAELTEGRTIKYWRSEWYTWKWNRYTRIEEDEFRAKVSFAIKEEFDRANIEAQEAFKRGQEAGKIDPNEDPPKAKKVTPGLVSSVLEATASLVSVPGTIELGTWLPTRERKNWISLQNGVLDIDKVLADAEPADCWIPNSPDWFSTVSLPYAFDLAAKCDRFEAVMEHNTDMDPERLKVLQEWAGYVLTPDMGEQKFLILEGEGSNGKSVYTAAITAMLGEDNVSTVPLEVFGERFDRTATLGKLLNAAGDCGEIDKVAEGYLKPFTSGDRMYFDRKGVPGVNCRPTARLQVACNSRPRFGDRSRGIWRRMLLIKFDVEITKQERIKGMDTTEFWVKSGELPGMLNWALRGLARLRAQNGFTDCESMNAEIEDYKEEMNPAKSFLRQYVEESQSGSIKASLLYAFYKEWAQANGYHPLGEKSFGKEVRRKFPKTERRNSGTRERRFYEYLGIQFSQDEVCGKNVREGVLF